MPSFWDGWESWSFTFRPHKQQERGLSGCAIESLVSNYYSVIGGRYSTLTCFVKVNGATKIVDANRIVDGVYILSCGHHFNNWGPPDPPTAAEIYVEDGTTVFQPDHSSNAVADYTIGSLGDRYDWAISKLRNPQWGVNQIAKGKWLPDFVPIKRYLQAGEMPAPGTRVHKYGASTGWTEGKITNTPTSPAPDKTGWAGDKTLYIPNPDSGFSDIGDSGALVCRSDDDAAVGMIKGRRGEYTMVLPLYRTMLHIQQTIQGGVELSQP